MKKLILVTNDAQSCGKTSIALVIGEYLRRKQVKHCLVNTAVEQELPNKAESLYLEDGIQPTELVHLLGKNDAVIFDIHTEGGTAFSQWFNKHGIEEILMELNADLTVVLPICDDAMVHREAMLMAEAYTGMAEFIAIQSPLLADVPETFRGSQLEKALRLLGASVITAPAIEDAVLDQIDEMDLTLPLALTQRPLLPRMLTHPLLAWEVEFGESLNEVSDYLIPQHEKIDDLGVDSDYGELLSA